VRQKDCQFEGCLNYQKNPVSKEGGRGEKEREREREKRMQ
jgi:hypothetical protein